ncbi:hypothetical protein SYNPS1DRAFT_26541 [Syncephalis pseudoplumigaleata]|uniref:Uncharacterized protein n=1 Tax=Syncephalis pseudoplumigaleata TaxID=1712513 RepID=A0A4P9Z5C1_9FUNG|nr:hypothetical protein SYNPS1DRAFT_26541 [Syncephalis pseudoplumigaleata]|eukprot:RKP27824.1 hypothetical protein SYNPS1DRAFT_26541 [Syncephalis pseudoplumigaleata]
MMLLSRTGLTVVLAVTTALLGLTGNADATFKGILSTRKEIRKGLRTINPQLSNPGIVDRFTKHGLAVVRATDNSRSDTAGDAYAVCILEKQKPELAKFFEYATSNIQEKKAVIPDQDGMPWKCFFVSKHCFDQVARVLVVDGNALAPIIGDPTIRPLIAKLCSA